MHSLDDDIGKHGLVYNAIERVLWALAPALIFCEFLSTASMQATRQEAEIRMDLAVAAENTENSGKWELPAGSAEHANCVRDLAAIRARTEQRVRDEITGVF